MRRKKKRNIETKAPEPEPEAGSTAPDAARLEELARGAEHAQVGVTDAGGGERVVSASGPGPYSGSGGPPKKGRPKGSKTKHPGLLIPREMVRVIIKAPYTLAANRLGPHWELSDADCEPMIEPHIALAQKYLPDVIKDKPELYTVLFLHALVLFAKAEAHVRVMREVRQAEAETPEPDTHRFRTPGSPEERPGADLFQRVKPAPVAPPPGEA